MRLFAQAQFTTVLKILQLFKNYLTAQFSFCIVSISCDGINEVIEI